MSVVNGKRECLNSDEFYCLMDLSNKKSNICYGDSGGPLMFYANKNWYLYGIASMLSINQQTKDCLSYLPSYYIMIPKYLDWIKKNSF